MPRPIRAVFDVGALRNNLAVAGACASRARVWAVVKANAYGHGLARTVHALEAAADGFALLDIDDAVRLREWGITQPILLLEGVFAAEDLGVVAEHGLTIVVHREEQIELLERHRLPVRVPVLLKMNTGMNRLGVEPEQMRGAFERLARSPAVAGITLMTHFADADGTTGVAKQMERFESAVAGIEAPRSLANSAAILRYPETHGDWIRPGIMLYGCSPFADKPASAFGLRPVMTLASELIAVRRLNPGDQVGYGGTFVAERPTRIGVVACGYADGYPRHAPTGTPVLVNGKRTQSVGRVSMDMMTVDVTDIPEAQAGTPVTLWGEGLSCDEVAAAAGTVSYELLCALAARVPQFEHG
jgi:alanine racemase